MQGIAKSITGYCWGRRDTFKDFKNRGACGLKPMPRLMEVTAKREEIKRRQQIGAHYSNVVRKAQTAEKIKQAISRATGRRKKRQSG